MRKIIQVSASGVENNNSTQSNWVCLALCDDGTVWSTDDMHRGWQSLPLIPQPDTNELESAQ